MKKINIILISVFILSILVACNDKATISNDIGVKESFFKSGSDDYNYVEIKKVHNNIWIHTTYSNYNGSRTPSNGIIAVSSKGLLLIDTPWNNEQTKELIKLTKAVFKQNIAIAIITHAHADRIGGIDTLLENKIDVRSTILTANEAEKYNYKKPNPVLNSKPNISFGNIKLETFYPGEGHTKDNITVWFPQFKLLFGGCLIKSLESKDLGNTADANVKQWPISVKKVLDKYSDAEIVIPGHGNFGDLDLVKHTLELASASK
jgi:metallo-beta-lactamase class B